jgi:hypothetical protein
LSVATGGQISEGGGGHGGGNGQPGGTVEQQVQRLLQSALEHFDKANAALRAGDLATYQDELDTAQRLVQQAQQLAAQAGGSGTTPSPSLSASASPSPTASASASPSPSA